MQVIQFPDIGYQEHIEFSHLLRAYLLEYTRFEKSLVEPYFTLAKNYRYYDMLKENRWFTPNGEELATDVQYSDVEYPITYILIGDLVPGFKNGVSKRSNGYNGAAYVAVETRACIVLREHESFSGIEDE